MDPSLFCVVEEIRCSFLYMTTEVLGLTNRYLNKQVIDCIMNYFFENQVGQLLKPKMQLDSLKKVKRVVEDAIACDSEKKYRASGLPKYMIFVNAYIDQIERFQIENEYISLLYDIILSDCNESAYSQEWMTTIRKKITAVLLLGYFNNRKNKTSSNTEDIFSMWKNVFPLTPLRKVKQNFKNKSQIPAESAENITKSVDIKGNQNTDEIGLDQGLMQEIIMNQGADHKKAKKITQIPQVLSPLAAPKPAKKRKTTPKLNSTKSHQQYPKFNALIVNSEDVINNNTNNNGDEEETRFPQGEPARFNEEEEFQERLEWDTPEEETNPQNYCAFKNITDNQRANEDNKSTKIKKRTSQAHLKSKELLKAFSTKKDLNANVTISQRISNLEQHPNPASNAPQPEQPQNLANPPNESEDCMSQVPSPAQYLNFDMNSLHFDSDHQQNYFYEHSSSHSQLLSSSGNNNISNSSSSNNNNYNLLNTLPNNPTNYYPTLVHHNTNSTSNYTTPAGAKGAEISNILYLKSTQTTTSNNQQIQSINNNKDNEDIQHIQNLNPHQTGIQSSNKTGISEEKEEEQDNLRELFNTFIPCSQEQFILQDPSQPSSYQVHSSDQQQLDFPLICSIGFQKSDQLELLNQDSPTRQLF